MILEPTAMNVAGRKTIVRSVMDFIIWLSTLASMLKAWIDPLVLDYHPLADYYEIDFSLQPLVAGLGSQLQASHHLHLKEHVLLSLVLICVCQTRRE